MRNLFINLQLAKKATIILIIIENLLPVDPPQHHMIDSRIAFYPRTSWHPITPLLYPIRATAQCQDREPSPVFPRADSRFFARTIERLLLRKKLILSSPDRNLTGSWLRNRIRNSLKELLRLQSCSFPRISSAIRYHRWTVFSRKK